MDQPIAAQPSARPNRPDPADANGSRPAVLRGPDRPDLLREESLAQILAATASRVPQHPALVWGPRIVSYGELQAASELLGDRAKVCGVEARADLVEFCRKVALEQGMEQRLAFRQGSIADTDVGSADVLIALHACDTATDDALAKGVAAGAALLVAAPCCQKEIRPQLIPPPVLSAALRHGIFEERQAEFVTDALRAQLLEWAGYRTRVIEFISTEHTAKNLMITAVRGRSAMDPSIAERIRNFAAFYGVRRQTLAARLGFALA